MRPDVLVIYTMHGCPFCEQAKAFLESKGLEFREVVVEPGSPTWREMKEKTGSATHPQLLIAGTPAGGYFDLISMEATGELYRRLGAPGRVGEVPLYDTIILGGGPAGMSAAIYTVRKMMKTIIICKELGGQISWGSDVENYLGFSQINALDLVEKFEDHVTGFGVEKLLGREAMSVELTGRIKRVILDDGAIYYGKTLIIATGGVHRPLNIPGERELAGKGVSYCSTCDAPLYRGASVAVVGGGNSALEAVLDLMNIAKRVSLISLTSLSGDPIYQGKIRQSGIVDILTDCQALRVLGDREVEGIEYRSLTTGQVMTSKVEGVFVEVGIMPNSTLFVDTLACNEKGEVLIDAECRTGVAGVFACGDVTIVPYKQVVVAVGEGSKAALSAYNYLINQK